VKQFNKPVALTNDVKAAVRDRYKLFPELDFGKSGYTVQLDPAFKIVNNQLAYLITVTSPDGVKVNYFYDAKSGLKIKQYTVAPLGTVMEWGDYREVETGIKIPYLEKTSVVGQPIEYKVKSVKVNSGLSDDLFK